VFLSRATNHLISWRQAASRLGAVSLRARALVMVAAALSLLMTADIQATPVRGALPSEARGLPSALTQIQQAFLSNDPSRLVRLFPRRGPVFVSMPPWQPGTFLSPGPLKAFLDRLVHERMSVRFELPASLPEAVDGQTASTFVKVKWTHRPAASATLIVDYLHLALQYAAEDAEWQIVEIKSSLR
jgi:hypothetical protein